jgi:hypothetical protein
VVFSQNVTSPVASDRLVGGSVMTCSTPVSSMLGKHVFNAVDCTLYPAGQTVNIGQRDARHPAAGSRKIGVNGHVAEGHR